MMDFPSSTSLKSLNDDTFFLILLGFSIFTGNKLDFRIALSLSLPHPATQTKNLSHGIN